jgi:hypothetical protein
MSLTLGGVDEFVDAVARVDSKLLLAAGLSRGDLRKSGMAVFKGFLAIDAASRGA